MLFLVSTTAFIGLIILYQKIYFITKTIKEINKKIEGKQTELDWNEIDNMGGAFTIDIDVLGDKQKYKRSLEQDIQRLQREKKYLLEEISIFKIFKK